MKIISEHKHNLNYGVIAIFLGFTFILILLANLQKAAPIEIWLFSSIIWVALFYFFVREFIPKTIEINKNIFESYFFNGWFLKSINLEEVTSWLETEGRSKITDDYNILTLFVADKKIIKINSVYYQNYDEIKTTLTHNLPFNYTKKANYEATENIGMGFTLMVFSVFLFYPFFSNMQIANSKFSFKNYEYITDKIDRAEINVFHNGKNSFRQILIYLENDRHKLLIIKGLEKNYIDERYFMDSSNWHLPMVFCVEKSKQNLKIVKGLSIKNINYINAFQLFKNKKNSSPTKAYIQLFIAMILLTAGASILIKNWFYLQNHS